MSVPNNLISCNKLVRVGGDDGDAGSGAGELGLAIPLEEGRGVWVFWGLGFWRERWENGGGGGMRS